ncbi:MAG: phosphonate C-P lyase system protein PhnK [Neomegalonema sp.]|nr:phosphonate C-P lyase system protein PhnK [Neomegalonema sp.]
MIGAPLFKLSGLTKLYGARVGCRHASLEVRAGEVLAVVGESGSGKSTLLSCASGQMLPTSGGVLHGATSPDGRTVWRDIYQDLSEPERRKLLRSEWAYVHQDARDGLRMSVSAGGNIGERMMAAGARRYGAIRREAEAWLARVEIPTDRLDDRPTAFSGGMRQRLQIARALATGPKLVFMDEPTGGLDVSVQARLLDLVRRLVAEYDLAVIIVTHDLAVARLLAHRMVVMKQGRIVESGLTDQILDDPLHPYSQLLVSSILQT